VRLEDLKKLIQDSQTMVQNINLLSIHANKQLDELTTTLSTVLGWSDRADHIVEEIGAMSEEPLINAVRNSKVLRHGGSLWVCLAKALGKRIARPRKFVTRIRCKNTNNEDNDSP
jgi:hypothetical protein